MAEIGSEGQDLVMVPGRPLDRVEVFDGQHDEGRDVNDFIDEAATEVLRLTYPHLSEGERSHLIGFAQVVGSQLFQGMSDYMGLDGSMEFRYAASEDRPLREPGRLYSLELTVDAELTVPRLVSPDSPEVE
ncbi:MAG TPA: hypothetical protein VGF75_02555 [Candidatus Saccharimonadales bacterium]|jgi:hypothetical protein